MNRFELLKGEHKKRIAAVNVHEDKLMELNNTLLQNIKEHLPKLEELLNSVNEDHTYGDMVYRFYHGSFKVYWVQGVTEKIIKTLKNLAPEGVTFNNQFEEIFKEGTGKVFSNDHNNKWSMHTRPMLEAFFHAKYFLEMAVKYGKELDKAPMSLPSGWAGLLYYYNLR